MKNDQGLANGHGASPDWGERMEDFDDIVAATANDQEHIDIRMGVSNEVAIWWERVDAEVRADGMPAAPAEVYAAERMIEVDVTGVVAELSEALPLPPQRQTDGLPAEDKNPRDVSDQLTRELARLLSTAIAQSQASGRPSGFGSPTGSELASLAALLSAAAPRPVVPVFSDGLSALSSTHTESAPQLGEASPMPAPDDEPMPIPSTWRNPGSYDEDRWLRQQLGATLLGLFAGLMIVVPAVLWLTGWIGPQRTARPATNALTNAASVARRPSEGWMETKARRSADTAAAAQYVAGSVEPRGSIEIRKPEQTSPPIPVAVPAASPQPAPVPAPKVEDSRARAAELIAQAMRRAEVGDVTGAREMLATAEGGAPGGPITFALAETYDPNKLAAWGTRGVAADSVKARALYTKALNLGVTRAQERLDALK